MAYCESDLDLFETARKELCSALLGDILDQLGYYNQFLSAELKPLDPEMVVAGRAMPVIEEDILAVAGECHGSGSPHKPFGLMFEALDDLREGEVYICSGSSNTYALWGELMSTRALKLGAAGAVVNGYSRDTSGILKLRFPTFSLGTFAQDQRPRGRVTGFRKAIMCNNIVIEPGVFVFGDRDGVIIIPREVEAEVVRGALEKARSEKSVSKAITGGMSSLEAFERFGVM